MRTTPAVVLAVAVALGSASLGAQDAGSVRGRVYGQNGEPLVNVEVVVVREPRDENVIARARTDGEGMFLLPRVPAAAPLVLLARAPGLTTALGRAFGRPDDGTDVTVTLRCWEAVTLRGRVVDADVAPVRGATVLATRDRTWLTGPFLPPEVRTDDGGAFELRGVPIGWISVRVHAPGFELAEVHCPTLVDATVEVPPLTRGDGQVLRVEVAELPPDPGPVEVRVHRDGGLALPSPLERAVLGADGTLDLRGLPRAVLSVRLHGPSLQFDPPIVQLPEGGPLVPKPEGALPTARFRAIRAGAAVLRGRLTDAAGGPLANLTLRARSRRNFASGVWPAQATTGADGAYTLAAPFVEGEPYSLVLADTTWVLAQPKAPRHHGSVDPRYLSHWEAEAGGGVLELVAVRAARVRAVVLDGDGRPVPFQAVRLQAWRDGMSPPWGTLATATSGRAGDVDFTSVRAPDADLRLFSEGAGGAGASERFRLAAGEHVRASLALQRGGTVRGRVRDAAGRPVGGVAVSLDHHDLATGRPIASGHASVSTDREGRFVFVDVPAGGHRVRLDVPGGVPIVTDVLELEPGKVAEADVNVR